MIPYLVLASVPFGSKLFSEILQEKYRKKFILIMSFLALFLLQCLRMPGAVGIDYVSYGKNFQKLITMPWSGIFTRFDEEYGFWILTKLITLVTHNVQIYMIILSFLVLLPIMVTYIRETNMPLITFVLFLAYDVFAMSFSGMRQSLALAIIFYCFRFVKKASVKNIIFYYLGVLLAYQFHISAIIAVLIYPIYHLKIKKEYGFFVVAFVFIIFIFKSQIFSMVLKIMPEKYLKYEITQTGAMGMLIFDIVILFSSFLFARKDDKELIGLRNMDIMVVIFRCFSPIHYLASRFAFYFIPFVALLIPKVLTTQHEDDAGIIVIVKILVAVGALALMFYGLLRNDAVGIYPYVFFWQ